MLIILYLTVSDHNIHCSILRGIPECFVALVVGGESSVGTGLTLSNNPNPIEAL